MKKLLVTVPWLAASLAGQGMRSDPAEVWAHLVKTHDKDQNGEITAEEYSRGDTKFARFDRNEDGVLTIADFERDSGGGRGRSSRGDRRSRGEGRGSSRSSMIGLELAKRADANRDGSVPAAEWQSFLDALEVDEDGVVDRAGLGLGSSGGISMMRSMVDRMLDVDRDGDVTTDDLQSIWDGMDGNGDGTVQRDELGSLPMPGEPAPDFELPYADDETRTVRLSSFAGSKPVALIFGSYT